MKQSSKRSGSPIVGMDGGVTTAEGFRAAAVKAGIKASKGYDVAVLLSDRSCQAAGTFTKNNVRSASVEWCEKHLPTSAARALICVSGNANACTGEQGRRDAAAMAATVARACGVSPSSVMVATTGVIGRFMPMDKVREAVPVVVRALGYQREMGVLFATSIMTTDLKRKEAAVKVTTSRGSYVIGGCAKGSGMIHPNMATMLSFITTDAGVDRSFLQATLRRVVDRTYNNLTVDGDTSTNDSVIVLANGMAGVTVKSASERTLFEQALFTVCDALCAKIAEDGEGATKRLQINVVGGRTYKDCKLAAKAIANSNLVKTAMFGNDPNWGRIVCALGYSGAAFCGQRMSVRIGRIPVCKGLRPAAFDAAEMQKTLRKPVVEINVDLGQGRFCAVAHTCDLTYDYIKINAEYHT